LMQRIGYQRIANLTSDMSDQHAKSAQRLLKRLIRFADARRGRYANFLALDNPNLTTEEPIRKWWGEVAEAILKKHYYGTAAQRRVETRAKAVNAMMGNFSFVHLTSETGETMNTVLQSSIRTGQTELGRVLINPVL
jgi:hypothetical protein